MLNLSSHIATEWNHLKGKNIYVSCSAGVDSTVLAFILKQLAFKVSVLHVNYQLRGEDSNLDALFVKAFCRRERITCLQKTINLQNQLENGGNLQETARNERYAWFKQIIDSNPDNYVALGHHQDDQVETFFLNLSRKSGLMGLSCMLKEHNNIIRPLLDFSRAEIIEYANQKEINWREDKSNTSNKYRRNLLRNVLLPELKSEIPSLDKSVLKLVRAFQHTQAEVSKKIQPITQRFIEQACIDIKKLNKLNDTETIEFLRQLNQPATAMAELLKLSNAQKGKKIKWGNSWLINEGEVLLLKQNSELKQPSTLNIEQVTTLPTRFNKEVIYLDKQKTQGNLHVRLWQVGDRIYPVGMKGSRLISDIISDAKLTASQKEGVRVVHDDEQIHWCVGFTVGRKAIAEVDSKNMLKLTIS
ncbi:MAG: tRNA lysidine(34) synthetase TilS [Crocinitomicaceae bacterium]|nr:tRNA lysidine(34) synthetase TilS [Crocinitomicaceae bacterium]MDG1776411.1 tRNA lysidine(34) synthetase TilS [Crocinitomicaceae bacterium]